MICARIVSATGIKELALLKIVSAPHDHLATSPNGRVSNSAIRGVYRGRCSPDIRCRVIACSRVHVETPAVSAPYDHLAAGPYCGVARSRLRGSAGRNPAVRARIVSPARIRRSVRTAAPNDHFATSPGGSVVDSWIGCVHRAGCNPCIRIWVVSSTSVDRATRLPAPYNHRAAAPNCGVPSARLRSVCRASCSPGICGRAIPSTCIQRAIAVITAPHDHFIAGPDRCVPLSGVRCVNCASHNPCVSSWNISSAAVTRSAGRELTTPDDHFAARPHCCVFPPSHGRIRDRRGNPSVTGGICTFRHCSTHLVHRKRSFRFRSIRPYDRFARRVRL